MIKFKRITIYDTTNRGNLQAFLFILFNIWCW